jgi:anti-anti-sigma regulatory factor
VVDPLSFGVDLVGGIPVLRLRGGLVFGQDLHAIRDTAMRLHSEGHERLVLDLSEAGATDSSGISALLDVRHIMGEREGAVTLLRPSDRLRGALAMARVAFLFAVLDDERDLVRHLGG